ncbi:unnamed protein product, partial [Sphenostylis stenocarpa]
SRSLSALATMQDQDQTSSSSSAASMPEEAESTQLLMEKRKLKTSDGEIIEVEKWIVDEMKVVKCFLDTGEIDHSVAIPVPNVTSSILRQIIELQVKKFDEGLVKTLSHEDLKQLLLAANYLEMTDVISFVAKTIADIIKDKTPKFVRKFFGIVNDFTPEEEAKLREANAWAFKDIETKFIAISGASFTTTLQKDNLR